MINKFITLKALLFLVFFLAPSASASAGQWTYTYPLGGTKYYCSDGFVCARAGQQAFYGDVIKGGCFYGYNSSGGLTVATCEGHTNSGFVRNGHAALECAAGEIRTGSGCLLQPPPDRQPRCAALTGNPIDTTSGMKMASARDAATAGTEGKPEQPGAPPLTFERTYTSDASFMAGRLAATRLGLGWRSNYDSAAFYYGASAASAVQIAVALPDGAERVFKKSSGQWLLSWYDKSASAWRTNRKGVNVKLVHDSAASLYKLTAGDDTVYAYDYNGRLASITARGGHVRTLTYDGAGNNATVSDNYGRTLTFAYTAQGLLDTVTAPDGTVTRYAYLGRYDPAVFAGVSTDLIGKEQWALETVVQPDATPADPDDNPRVRYHYEDAAHPYGLTGVTDERGVRAATWSYGADGRAVSSEHAGGADHYTLSYDDAAGTVTETNPYGKTAVYRFASDAQGQRRLTRIEGAASTHCAAADTAYTYDADNFVADVTDGESRVNHRVNDAQGRPTTVVDAYGTASARTTGVTWHATLNLPTQIVEPGVTTAFTYDAAGRPLTVILTDTTTQTVPYSTNGRTRQWTYTYNAQGLAETADGPRADVADVTHYTYDSHGYLATVTDALSHTSTVTAVDGMGRPTGVTDAGGVVRDIVYDAQGRPTSITVRAASGDAVTTLAYDASGRVTAVTPPGGASLTYTYDNVGRLISIANPDGEHIDYTLDVAGRPTAITVYAAAGTVARTQSRVYDELGRLLQTVGAAGQTWSYAYDRVNALTGVTDPRGGAVVRGFDALGRLVSETRPLSASVALGYDAGDRLNQVTDPRGVITTYVYDGFGDPIRESSPDAGVVVFEVDAAGNRTRRTDGRGVVADYAYDALNRVVSTTYPAAPAENLSFGYDDATNGNFGVGRLTSASDNGVATAYTYDARGNLLRESRTVDALAAGAVYAYDLADRLTRITYPSGRIVDYARDGQGRITGVTTRLNALASPVTLASNLTYRPFGPPASATLGNGLAVVWTYNLDGRLTDLTVTGAGGAVQDLGHGYDPSGNPTAITDRLDAARSQVFSYDALDRLTQGTGPYGGFDYTWDAAGNRTQRVRAVGGIATTEIDSYPADSNRLSTVSDGSVTRTLGYSGSGHVVSDAVSGGDALTLVYDASDRQVELKRNGLTEAGYRFDAAGRRVSKTTAGTPSAVRTDFVHDPAGHLLAEIDGLGVPIREYVWLGDLPLTLIVDPAGAATFYRVHPDRLGSPQKMTDGGGAVVWDAAWGPFGEAFSVTAAGIAANPLRFPGQYFDAESGRRDNGRRVYDPDLGRYLQSDPIGLAGGLNRYAYVGGNPLRRTDPTGLRCEDGLGCWTTPDERAFADQGDYAGYYGLACANGDTYACFAGRIAANDGIMANLTTFNLRRALHNAADRFALCYDESSIMEKIRIGLAKEYADLLPNDPHDAEWPTADGVAKFHWNVFGRYGVPPSAFGGTPFGPSVGPILPSVWCPNCRTGR